MKIWNKFHPLFESDLQVGFETTFPKEADLGLDSSYGNNGLIHNSPREPVIRVYEPTVGVVGSCKYGDIAQVSFMPVTPAKASYRRLVFSRKYNKQAKKPWCWMLAARHSEVAHFGFDSWNSHNDRYLSLAYPGLNKRFLPVYVKIQQNGCFVYLELLAWDDERKNGKVVVQGRRVSEDEVPETLALADPNFDPLLVNVSKIF